MVPAVSFVAGCWFGNPRHPDLWTWVEGISSANLLRDGKHAEADACPGTFRLGVHKALTGQKHCYQASAGRHQNSSC